MKKEKAVLIQKEYEVEGEGYGEGAEPLAGALSRGGGIGKGYTGSVSRQEHAQGDCRGWGETRGTLRMTSLPRVTSHISVCRGSTFQVTAGIDVVMYGNNRMNTLAL